MTENSNETSKLSVEPSLDVGYVNNFACESNCVGANLKNDPTLIVRNCWNLFVLVKKGMITIFHVYTEI